MEESGILEHEDGQWLDFLPTKTSDEPERAGAEGVGVMAELGRIFFSNSALTVNLVPFILIATLVALVFVYPGIDALLWFYFKFYGRILSKFASYSHDRVGLFSQWADDKDWDADYQYEDVSSLLREYEEEFIPNHQQQQQGFTRRNNKQAHLLGHRLSQLSEQDLALLN